jgi:hypothetical protein
MRYRLQIVTCREDAVRTDEPADLKDQGEKKAEKYDEPQPAQEEPAWNQAVRGARLRVQQPADRRCRVQSMDVGHYTQEKSWPFYGCKIPGFHQMRWSRAKAIVKGNSSSHPWREKSTVDSGPSASKMFQTSVSVIV